MMPPVTHPREWHADGLGHPSPDQQQLAGCTDGHDPASATGICTRCGYDCLGYYADLDLGRPGVS